MYNHVEKTKMTITTSMSRTVPFLINYTVLGQLFKAHFGRNLTALADPIEEEEILLDADIVNGIFDSITYTILRW